MAMISRDWCCLNRRCGAQFHSFDSAPECPKCGNVRVSWIPGGGHIGKVAPQMDQRLRGLAQDFGLTDLNSPSPSRLNRAAPRANHPHPTQARGQKTFAPGFTSNVYDKAACEWSQDPIHMRGFTTNIGSSASPFQRSANVPGPSANAVWHGRHRASIPT